MCTGTHPFIPAPNVVKLEIRSSLYSQQVENVVHARTASAPTPAVVDALAAVAANWWHTQLNTWLSNQVTFLGVLARDLTVEDGYSTFDTSYAGEVGIGTDALMPNQTSFVINLNTALHARAGLGKFYWFGIPKVHVNGNELTATLANGFRGYINDLKTDLLEEGGTMCVVSYCYHNAWRTVAGVNDVVSVSYHDLLIDSQRRRKPGVGR